MQAQNLLMLDWSKLAGHYPDTPGHKRAGTSEEAARLTQCTVNNTQQRILDHLTSNPAGKTPDEIANHMNLSVLYIRPRCSELLRLGKIRETTLRRRNASGKRAAVLTII